MVYINSHDLSPEMQNDAFLVIAVAMFRDQVIVNEYYIPPFQIEFVKNCAHISCIYGAFQGTYLKNIFNWSAPNHLACIK